MLYCTNPNCSNPFNPDSVKFCISCGTSNLQELFRNRYRIEKLLGEGGFGRTYQAIDLDRLNTPCVIKQFSPKLQGTSALTKATDLFQQEAQRLFELEHPQIPRLIAYFEQNKRLYLVQELIIGNTLLQEHQTLGPFNESKIRHILSALLPVLKYIHDNSVIHRDLKPENIMRRSGQNNKTKINPQQDLVLIDFGVAKQAPVNSSGQGTIVGTQGYAPLEQMRGQVYPASDLYSLGVTCIRLLTGCFPENDGNDSLYDSYRACWAWREHLTPVNKTISPELGSILDKLLADFVQHRYQSAEQVLTDINQLPPLTTNSQIQSTPTIVQPTKTNIPQPTPTQNGITQVTQYTNPFIKTNIPQPTPTQNPPHPPPITQPSIKLLSTSQINYEPLQNLLTQNDLKLADDMTSRIIKKLANSNKPYLEETDLRIIPAEDIKIIDQIWTKHSDNRFGFSIQKQIWLAQGGTIGINHPDIWIKFAKTVGWILNDKWLYYDQIKFDTSAPIGHLPIIGLGKWTDGTVKWLFTGQGLTYQGIIHTLIKKL